MRRVVITGMGAITPVGSKCRRILEERKRGKNKFCRSNPF